jgi:hypothetical protein
MQGRGRGNVAAERLCGALFVRLKPLKGYFYTNLGGTLFVHAKLAIDEDFLALLNEVPEILGGLTPYLEVHKSGDLFFFPLSVDEMLVVGDRGRDDRLTTRRVSEFGIVGEISGHVDCVDVHMVT